MTEDTSTPYAAHNRALAVAIGAAFLLILALYAVTASRDDPTPPRTIPTSATEPPKPPTVEYRLGGHRTTADITLSTPGGTSQAQGVRTPETISYDGFRSGDFLYVSAQIADPVSRGRITCEIVVDGQVVAESTAVGFPSIVSCEGRMP